MAEYKLFKEQYEEYKKTCKKRYLAGEKLKIIADSYGIQLRTLYKHLGPLSVEDKMTHLKNYTLRYNRLALQNNEKTEDEKNNLADFIGE